MSAFYSPPVFIIVFRIFRPVYFCAENAREAIVCTLKHYRHQNSRCQEILLKKPQKRRFDKDSCQQPPFFVHLLLIRILTYIISNITLRHRRLPQRIPLRRSPAHHPHRRSCLQMPHLMFPLHHLQQTPPHQRSHPP